MFKHFQTFISSRTILSFALSGKCCVKHIGKGPPTWYILLVHYSVHWWILTTFVFSSLVDICFLKNFADHQSSCTCLAYKCTSIWPLCAPSQCVILITVFPELTPYYSPWVDPPPPQPFLLWWPTQQSREPAKEIGEHGKINHFHIWIKNLNLKIKNLF